MNNNPTKLVKFGQSKEVLGDESSLEIESVLLKLITLYGNIKRSHSVILIVGVYNIFNMQNCLLCQHNEADKTGSHIIPSFLMKWINGGGERDHEIGFEIRGGLANVYFGRDIYEEERKSLTDNGDKLDSRENLDVRDHIFCKGCERYFSVLESRYAQSLNLNYTEGKLTTNNKVSSSEALLFWFSIVWRVSITEHLGNRLRADLEERLRVALSANNIDGLDAKYALFRCKDYCKNTGRGTFAYMDVIENDVILVVDEYLLIMTFDMADENHEVKLFENRFTLKRDALNDGIMREEISSIPSFYFSCLMDSILQKLISNMQLPRKFNEMHKIIFGTDLPDDMLNDIIQNVLNTWKLGDRYTVEHYAWCYKEILIKYGLIRDNANNTYTVLDRIK